MEAKIRTFEDLETERVRLEALLAVHRTKINQDISQIREELKPVKKAVSMIGKFFSKDKSNPMLNLGVDFLGDVLLKNVLFSRAGFVTRQIAPWLIKNFGTHFLHDNGSGILDKISGVVRSLTARFKSKAA